jgi:hypothetical protein
MIDTMRAALSEILSRVVLDLTTGKARPLWTRKDLRRRLNMRAVAFSRLCTGARSPSSTIIEKVLEVVKEERRTADLIAPLEGMLNRARQDENIVSHGNRR